MAVILSIATMVIHHVRRILVLILHAFRCTVFAMASAVIAVVGFSAVWILVHVLFDSH